MLRNSSAQKRESRHSNREHLFALRFFVHTSDSYRLCFGRVRLSNVRGGRGQALEHARVCGRSWLWVNIYPCFPIILETRKEPVSITCRDHACNKHAVYIPAAEDDALHGTKTARYNFKRYRIVQTTVATTHPRTRWRAHQAPKESRSNLHVATSARDGDDGRMCHGRQTTYSSATAAAKSTAGRPSIQSILSQGPNSRHPPINAAQGTADLVSAGTPVLSVHQHAPVG